MKINESTVNMWVNAAGDSPQLICLRQQWQREKYTEALELTPFRNNDMLAAMLTIIAPYDETADDPKADLRNFHVVVLSVGDMILLRDTLDHIITSDVTNIDNQRT